jgi:hypothetical protein
LATPGRHYVFHPLAHLLQENAAFFAIEQCHQKLPACLLVIAVFGIAQLDIALGFTRSDFSCHVASRSIYSI